MQIAFTICSLNYFAQALSLGESLSKTNPHYKFIIGLVDKLEGLYKNGDKELISLVEKSAIIEIDKLGIPNFNSFCSKYNITELNTAVKPYYFDYFFQNMEDLDSVIYFDPDIIVYSGLEELDKQLENNNFVVTPHTLSPIDDDGLDLDEKQINRTGLYNLGFIAIKNTNQSRRFIDWWKARLYKYCYVDYNEGLFVDQIWVNFLPLYFKDVWIERDLGYNVAYWNLHERFVSVKNNHYTINNETGMKFYHFSGFQPDEPAVISKYQNRFTFEQRKDIKQLFDDYSRLLNDYSYGKFAKIECFYGKNYKPYSNTPVLFIVFKNLVNMEQVFKKIKKTKPRKLYVASYITLSQFSDIYYIETAKMLLQVDWDCDVRTLYLHNNSEYFKDPVSWFFHHEEEGIILNDDFLPDDSFFEYCTEMLNKYRDDNRVGHISGMNLSPKEDESCSFHFSSLVNVSAWATWRRVWQTIDFNMRSVSRFVSSNSIENNRSYGKYKNYWNGVFMKHVSNSEMNDWTIPYTYHNLINNYLSVVPNNNLIEYIGDTNSAEKNNIPFVKVPIQSLTKLQKPEFVICNHRADWAEQEVMLGAKNKTDRCEDLKDGYTFIKDRFVELSKQNEKMKIPRIIHQIYEDPAGPSSGLSALAETWKEQHPDWEYRFWNRKTIEGFLEAEFPDFVSTYRTYPYDVQRWHSIRYLILYRIGGLYVDMDYECLVSMDSLLNGSLCCMGMEPAMNAVVYDKPVVVGNALMASVPNHPYFESMIKDMMNGEKYTALSKSGQIMETTGSFMTTRLYERYLNKDEITLLPADLVMPFTADEVREMAAGLETPEIEDRIEKCFAIHYFFGSWIKQMK